jgi:omega-amidase
VVHCTSTPKTYRGFFAVVKCGKSSNGAFFVKIALLQMDGAWENPARNHERARALAAKAGAGGARLCVLPEMFSTGFTMNVAALREDSGTERFLADLARECRVAVVAGYAERARGGRARNLAGVWDAEGGLLARYAKMHPFSPAGEDRCFEAGEGPVLFGIEGMEASVFICYDLRFPEVFREVAPRAAALFVLANWPRSRREHWLVLLRARAIENQCFVVGVNRVGTDGNGIAYCGDSAVFGPEGETLLVAGDGEGVFPAELDPALVQEARRRLPALRDRRR